MKRQPNGESGFTIVELLVATLILAAVFVFFLSLLEGTSTVATAQNDLADVSETLRFTVEELVRIVRMAGTGGLPLLAPGPGGGMNVLAVDVQDNVAGGAAVFGGLEALEGTDVLTLRGVITGELYDVVGAGDITDLGGGTSYRVTVDPVSPYSGQAHELVTPPVGTPVLFSSKWELPVTLGSGQVRYFNKYNIGLVTAASLDGSDPSAPLILDLKTSGSNDAENEILALNEDGTFQPFQNEFIIAIGFLDDMVFFISENSEGEPALFLYTRSDDTAIELVPGIRSLQVALGCDVSPTDGHLAELGQSADDDEWFFNVPGDRAPTAVEIGALHEVRISVVARSASPDPRWTERLDMPENAPALEADELEFRHRSVSVQVTVRSHPPLETT